MLCSKWKTLPICLLVTAFIFVGCGGSGGGGGTTMPATPTFTSTPATAAEEGVMYSYQVTATSSDMSAITYELSSGPSGATLAGNTVSWTPTHQESRGANAFTVKATTAAGGSATQTWNVTPNGTVNITAVVTYWTPDGTTFKLPTWQANLPYPTALVPQSDGTLQRLQGAANADGSFSIPNVPEGYYWLQINPNANFWTPSSDFAAFVEPYVMGRSATSNTTSQLGLAFTLLRPSVSTGFFPLPPPYACGVSISIGMFPGLGQGNPPITVDTDYGAIAYNDPYPASWQHNFQYCQLSSVSVQRPNSNVTDTFTVGTSQITPLPTGPVTPILGPVQSPMINGSSLFTPATLNTTNVTLDWNAPAIGHPFGYYIAVYQLVTGPTGTMVYAPAGVYATAKTSVNIPFLAANNVYEFSISSEVDAITNVERAPLRHQVPTGRSGVISAPVVIAPGATAMVKR